MTLDDLAHRESETAHRLALVEHQIIAEAVSLIEQMRSTNRPTLVNLGRLGALVDLRRQTQTKHVELIRACRLATPKPAEADLDPDLH